MAAAAAAAAAATTARAWEALPAEVWAVLLAALTGTDLLRLSHASAWTWRLLAAQDETLWRARVLGTSLSAAAAATAPVRPHMGLRSWREAFACHRVLQFPGLRADCMDDDGAEDARAFVTGLRQPEALRWWLDRPASLSVDAWICLLPSRARSLERADRFPGGVVFGLQSSPCASPSWPHVRAQLMAVDARGHLHCSVLGDRQPLKLRRLTLGRWYHVALTFAHDGPADGTGRQRVYIDGELVSARSGRLHPDWRRLEHCQVGTGYVADGLLACPRADFRGWYGFHGLVDELRVWSAQLRDDEVQQLADIRSPELVWNCDDVCFSMQRDGLASAGVARADWSRPSEGLYAR